MKMKLFAAGILIAGFAALATPAAAAGPAGPVSTGIGNVTLKEEVHYRRYRHRHCFSHRHYRGGRKHRHCYWHRGGRYRGHGVGIYLRFY
jgi:hypothetical protein